jgi:leucyl-tRNA---protein transferase
MLEHSPVRTYIVEYREPSSNGCPGKLVGACITDQQADGLSMIYSFYDTENPLRQGLGTYIILDHIARARAAALPYVYLGYWVKGSPRMEYKTRFRPMEALNAGGWAPVTDAPVEKVAELV